MRLTPATVAREHEWVRERVPTLTDQVNETRERLGAAFDTDVAPVTESAVRAEVDAVFADGDRAVNVAAYVGMLRDLDVDGDYPGFVVDERLGRALAATIAGGDPSGLLAEATFHVADIYVTEDGADADDAPAGIDDLDAALAAGLQTRLPGWSWREAENPFG